ncbi:hypothetical protein [uncultured Arthrobacter sp.]|uniref:hypothetical protein n=1 Tax=uncultured Arthrobacter sp. TaxID=114050 RepID=UPI003217EA07
MGQLKHFLGGLACEYFGRRPRRTRRTAQPGSRGQQRHRKHLERCSACRERQQRERQYLERLRGAAVPAASEDLTARLLARTGALAAGQENAAADEGTPAPQQPSAARQLGLPRRTGPTRVSIRIAGAVAASGVLVGGAAYLLGGETALPADEAFTSAFAARNDAGPALSAESVAGAAWKLSSGPDVAPAGSLTAGQLAQLRARGWACPELRELGYHLVWARGGVADGSEVLELRLTDGRHFATVLEQHAGGAADRPGTAAARHGAGQPAAAPPVNVLTGHPATEDGFVAAPLDTAAAGGSALPAGDLWVNRQGPFRAIYRTPAATFTYISELPAEQADDGVGALVHARPAKAAALPDTEAVPVRLERGLERILELLAR